MTKLLSPIVIVLIIASHANSAKILGIFPAPAPSHYILGSSLMRALAEKGHDVTMISAFGEKEPPKNGSYRDIVLTEIAEASKALKDKNTGLFDREGASPFIGLLFFGYMMSNLLEGTLKDENVQKLINSDEKFDVVIIEQFLNDAQKALAKHFDAELVVMSTVGANYMINSLVGNPSPVSYIPGVMMDYSLPMSFSERLTNTIFYIFNDIYAHLYIYPKQNKIIQKYIPNPPDIYDVIYNTSIVLMNSHTSTNQPVPYVPNMIDIGGFHVKPPKKLPKELQEFLDNAKEGVVYFSMGSNLKSAQLPIEKREAILKSLAKLKEKVLWKWEDDDLPGKPENVKLAKWLPQQDILAHPNVKLFITHGGFLSTTETIYHGVPVLAIPIFGDQKLNAKTAVNNGYGLMLPYGQISEETFTKNIQEILNNPKYTLNAKRRSQLFHDRIVSPMDTAIYWIEYVVRHKGAPHLRVAALDLPWYKYFLLDVMVVLGFAILTVIFISRIVIKLICKKLCSKKKNEKLKTK